jgi:hypothetical protein
VKNRQLLQLTFEVSARQLTHEQGSPLAQVVVRPGGLKEMRRIIWRVNVVHNPSICCDTMVRDKNQPVKYLKVLIFRVFTPGLFV